MSTFQLDVVTPTNSLFSGDAESVTSPGINGKFQVLSGHAPFISALDAGEIVILLADKSEKKIFITSGFFEVSANKVIALVD